MRTWLRSPAIGGCLWLMLTAGATLGPAEAAPGADQKRVLALYATRRDAQIAVLGDHELPRILDEGGTLGLDYYAEYIDVARFPEPEYRAAFSTFLQTKYQGRPFDLVIAMQDVALDFIDRTRSELFRDAPVVFFSSTHAVHRVANSTGVIAEHDFGRTVAMVLELQPDVRQVFVVTGADDSDKAYERQARAQLRPFEPRLTVTYLSGLPTKELEARLAALPAHSIVYFLIVSRDGAGALFHPLEYVDRVTAIASAPTYCWVNSAMNHGIVGGSLKDQDAEIRALATLALRVLHGERADSIPLASPDLTVRQVDWRQLRRWGISESRVPAGTLIRFRAPGAWERYRLYIASAVAVLLTQVLLIAALLVQAARRRGAELKLHASQDAVHTIGVRLRGTEERERSRIARELHDDIGQRMAALTMALDGLHAKLPPATIELRSELRALSDQSLELAKDIQSISRTLHASKLEALGLVLACADLCRELSMQQTVHVDFSHHGDVPNDVPNDVALCVFRVFQEAMNNVVKHARARRVTVALQSGGDEIRLEVVDDGIGFDPDAALKGPGLGLISMKQRVSLVGGELFIESRPGAGATIRVRAPFSGAGGRFSGAKG